MRAMTSASLSVIDMAPLFGGNRSARVAVGEAIGAACRDSGFFYATGHGIAPALLAGLESASRTFFALPELEKMEIAMAKGGRAWRGYFPVGGELTSGKPDQKEGLYFGSELGPDDPRVKRGLPLHGANLFPKRPKELRNLVLEYIEASRRTADALMEGVALSLGLEADYFYRQYTHDPTILFRIFHYPSIAASSPDWGVGEHTDYGLLTLLAQDANGGLQVKTARGWVEAPPIPDTLVCNIGDMLDRLTGGLYRSTPHRAKNISGRGRLSFPFFFDPGFDAKIHPLPERASVIVDDQETRWDRQSVHGFSGTYGDYLLAKVSHVFPDLRRQVIS
jgi:isopenicillin N synthase-like dioxygenase